MAALAAFGVAFAIAKATSGSDDSGGDGGTPAIEVEKSAPRLPAVSPPAALPGLRSAPAPSGGGGGGGGGAPPPSSGGGGGAPPSGGGGGAPPSGGGGGGGSAPPSGGGGGGGPIIEG